MYNDDSVSRSFAVICLGVCYACDLRSALVCWIDPRTSLFYSIWLTHNRLTHWTKHIFRTYSHTTCGACEGM